MTNFTKKGLRVAILGGSALGALMITLAPVQAQQAPVAANGEEGDPIVVTARRREEVAQNVPIALSVVSSATLESTGNYTIGQLQGLVPSLQTTSLNPRNSNINIRGLGTNSSVALDGLEPGFGFYVDGVYYARPGQAQFDLIDLDRVEVLKGPQGTLFGKNTTAGAINISTRLPSFTPEATIEGGYGNYDNRQLRASVSLPLIADKVAVRLTIADSHHDGYIQNRLDDRDAQDYDNLTVRGQLLVKPTETLSIRLIGDYSNNKQHSIGVTGQYFSTYANGATIPNNIFVRAARTGYTLTPSNPFGRQIDLDADYKHFSKSYGVSGEINWDLGTATLTSATAYRWWDWYPLNDIDGTSLDVQVSGLNNHQRQFSQELRVASNGTNEVDYVAGLYYFWQSVEGEGYTAYGKDYAAWNLNPATSSAATIALTQRAMDGFRANMYSDPRTKSYAAFGQADWHINDQLTLTAGLRYTHEDKSGYYRQVWVSGLDLSTLPAADRATALAARAVSPQLDYTSQVKANALSGLATLSYKPTQELLVYATYSRGNKSGGLNLSSGGAFKPVIRPEKVNAYEIGIKSQWLDRRLTLNAALFQEDVHDYQASILEFIGTTTSTRSYIANIPKVRSRGVEVDATLAAAKWLSFTASAAYTDAKYLSYVNGPQAVERANVGGAIQDLSGVQLPYIPKFAYSLAADLSQPVGNGLLTYSRLDFSHRSSVNATNTNSIYGVIPAYGLVNLRVGLRSDSRLGDVSAFVRNLGDKNYYLSRSAGAFGVVSSLLGDPRTYGVTLRTKI